MGKWAQSIYTIISYQIQSSANYISLFCVFLVYLCLNYIFYWPYRFALTAAEGKRQENWQGTDTHAHTHAQASVPETKT